MTAPETEARHLIGLLLGTEDDWPAAFESIVGRLGPVQVGPNTHTYATERVTIEPFDLRADPHYDVVIDRLAYWYHVPREWLKKVALMDDVYLLNSPFTFQAMEKHAAYCAMIRLGLKVPNTWLVPYKQPVEHAKYAYTAARYNRPFDLEQVAEQVGYPLYMKPYDGGAWRGVSEVRNPAELHHAYDESGEMLMHLQAAVDGYDVFARSLSIGAETMVMRFRPERPMHDRYAVDHAFLEPEVGAEVTAIGRIVNAFFRWEFNSCETLLKGPEVHPIDYANACPDVAITSLHYYFPWAMRSLVQVVGLLHRDRAQAAAVRRHDAVVRDRRPRRPVVRREGRGVREAGGRLLRDRALPRLLRQPPRAPRRDRPRLRRQPGVRRPARRHGQGAVPGARARPLRRALPRAAGPLGVRRASADVSVYERWYSPRLEQEIGLVRYGHYGRPVLLFPTAGGDAHEAERQGLVHACAGLLADGRVKIYSCDSTAGQALLHRHGSPEYRMWLFNQFQECVRYEVVPAIAADSGGEQSIVVAGSSIGAYNSIGVLARYPDVFGAAVCMSGTYEISRFLEHQHGLDLYLASAGQFLPGLEGPPLEQLRTRFAVLATGSGDYEDVPASRRMGEVLGAKGVPHRVDVWGPEWPHDWQTWHRMLPQYLDELC